MARRRSPLRLVLSPTYLQRVASGPDGIEREWEIEFYEDERGEKPVLRWIKEDLSPTKRRAIGTAMRQILQSHGPDVCSSHWGKNLKRGVMEFRLEMHGDEIANTEATAHGITAEEAKERYDLDTSEKVLLRVFFATQGKKVILLLHGYDKGEDTNSKRQDRELEEARRRLREVRQREQLKKKASK